MTRELRPTSPFWPIALLYVLSAFIVFVALRIESLNVAAGYPLPRLVKALKENRDAGGSSRAGAYRGSRSSILSPCSSHLQAEPWRSTADTS